MIVTPADYKVLAVAFCYPDESSYQTLKGHSLFRQALQTISLIKLQRQHNLLFALNVAGGLPPYETEYGPREIFRKTQNLANISGFYRAFGMELSATRERVDFIGAELELMHWLTLKEIYAEEQGKTEQAELCREAAKKFLQQHLGRWAPFVADQMGERSDSVFYRMLARYLKQLIQSECKRFAVTPTVIKHWDPQALPSEFTCEMNATPRHFP